MHVYDIVTESNRTDEAPVGAVKQGLRRLGAKAAGAVGMKGTAGNLGAKAEAGKEANQLKTQFNSYLGKQMKNIKQATAQDLARYLKQRGYSIEHMKGMKGVLQPKQIDDATLQAVINKADSDEVAGVGSDKVAVDEPKSASKKKGVGGAFVQGVKQASGKTAKPKLPAKLMGEVNKLSDQQKQALVRLLSK